jgi:hypothetical protein
MRLLAIEPDFTIELFLATTPFVRRVDRELYAEGLRLAGIPERDEHAMASMAGYAVRDAS